MLGASLAASLAAALPVQAATSDLVEGIQNWVKLDMQLMGQMVTDMTTVSDQAGVSVGVDVVEERRSSVGMITVKGLSSFSFVHGLLVGATLIVFLAAPKLAGGRHQARQPASPEEAHRQEVEAALQRLLAQPDMPRTFTDPAVHAAMEDLRRDPANIDLSKYRNSPAVMQAFEKLLDIEGILEKL